MATTSLCACHTMHYIVHRQVGREETRLHGALTHAVNMTGAGNPSCTTLPAHHHRPIATLEVDIARLQEVEELCG
jgi:hypothetical protein